MRLKAPKTPSSSLFIGTMLETWEDAFGEGFGKYAFSSLFIGTVVETSYEILMLPEKGLSSFPGTCACNPVFMGTKVGLVQTENFGL